MRLEQCALCRRKLKTTQSCHRPNVHRGWDPSPKKRALWAPLHASHDPCSAQQPQPLAAPSASRWRQRERRPARGVAKARKTGGAEAQKLLARCRERWWQPLPSCQRLLQLAAAAASQQNTQRPAQPQHRPPPQVHLEQRHALRHASYRGDRCCPSSRPVSPTAQTCRTALTGSSWRRAACHQGPWQRCRHRPRQPASPAAAACPSISSKARL